MDYHRGACPFQMFYFACLRAVLCNGNTFIFLSSPFLFAVLKLVAFFIIVTQRRYGAESFLSFFFGQDLHD